MHLENKNSFIGHSVGMIAYIIGIHNLLIFKTADSLLLYVLGLAGMILLVYCWYLLYFRKDGRTYLITDGVFKYTRHPMYTGAALTYVQFFNPDNYTLIFWVLTVIHYTALVVVGYYQEKETIERFNTKAIEYYQKTPRLFIFYPLRFLMK